MKSRWTVAGLASAALLASLATSSFAPPSAEATGRRGFSERDLKGTWSAYFEGEATEGPLTGHATAIGLVRFDGRGNYVVWRTVNIGGALIAQQRGDCTYSVEPSGAGVGECEVTTVDPPGIPTTTEQLALTMTSTEHAYFMSITPGLSAVGEAMRQSRPRGRHRY